MAGNNIKKKCCEHDWRHTTEDVMGKLRDFASVINRNDYDYHYAALRRLLGKREIVLLEAQKYLSKFPGHRHLYLPPFPTPTCYLLANQHLAPCSAIL